MASTPTFKQELIELADEYIKSGSIISFDEANALWKKAEDGPGVTETEFATLSHILENYKFTGKARRYLDPLATKQSSGTSLYKQINNVKYDRSCLDLAAHLAKDGRIDQGDAEKLWKDVEDGNVVTDIEKATIAYIRDNNTLTEGAKAFFASKLGTAVEESKQDAPMEEAAPKKSPKKPAATPEPSTRPTRVRKQVTQFAPTVTEKVEKAFVVPEGPGTQLGDIPNVNKRLDMTKAVESHLKKLHGIVFPGVSSVKTVVKSHLRQFKGFDPKDSNAVDDATEKLGKSQLDQLKLLQELLDVQCSGSKDDRIEAIVEFLKSPADSGREFAKKSSGTKRKASTKKKSKKKAKKAKSDGPKKLSSFMHFAQAMRPKIKAKNPDATFGELGRLVGAAWREADDKTKAKYQKMSETAVPAKKKAAAKKSKKEESSDEEESEEESGDDEPLSASMPAAMKARVKEIIDGTEDLTQLTRKKIKQALAESFDDVDNFGDELKEYIGKCVQARG